MGEASRRGSREERIAQAIARQQEANRLSRERLAHEAERSRQRLDIMHGPVSHRLAGSGHFVDFAQLGRPERLLELEPERRLPVVIACDPEPPRRRIAVLGHGHSPILAATLLMLHGFPVIVGDERKRGD